MGKAGALRYLISDAADDDDGVWWYVMITVVAFVELCVCVRGTKGEK